MNEFHKKIQAMFQKRKNKIDYFGREFAKSRLPGAKSDAIEFLGGELALQELLDAIKSAGPNNITTEDIVQAIEARIESCAIQRSAAEREFNYISEKLAAYEGGRNE